ncbi:MAG TPA: phage major capsid protein [Usitatibacter sp.]|nr:phage major capsid protein [Usitatibacter sp.]
MNASRKQLLIYGLVALLVVAAGFSLAGHPLIPHDLLAGLGGIGAVPFMMGDTQSIAGQISSFEAKRMTSMDRMTAIMARAAEDGRTLEDAETQEYDTLAAEVKAVDGHIVRLKAHEVTMVSRAKPVTPDDGADADAASRARAGSGGSVQFVAPNVEPGVRFARLAIALHQARGNRVAAAQAVQANRRWMDQTPEIAKVLMAAVPAADTTTAGWASELAYAQNLQSEFINFLRPMTVLGRLQGMRRVPFNVRIGSLTSGTTGFWVGQGAAIPMSKGTTGSLSLGITKAAGMSAYDDEILRVSTPSIEIMVRDDLGKAVAQTIDLAFLDPSNGGITNVEPASVLYGITPITPSGTNAAAISVDVAAVFAAAIAAFLDPSQGVWVMSPTTALKLSLMLTSLGTPQYPTISITGGTWQGLPVIVSPNLNVQGSPSGTDFSNAIMLIFPPEIILADDGDVSIDISNEASIQMLDNPTNLSTGATAPTTTVSMFQTQSWAIKAVRYINWVKRRAAAAAWIKSVAYQ